MLLISASSFAFSGYPSIRYGDKVEILTGGSQEAWFYKCGKTGKVDRYKDAGLKNCSFQYFISHDNCKDYTIQSWYCGKSLKKLKSSK